LAFKINEPLTERTYTMLKKILVLAMLSTAAFAQEPTPAAPGANNAAPKRAPSRAKKLTNAEFDAYLAHPENVLLIDVRRPDEISTIGGFPVYLSIQAKDIKNHLSEIPRDRPIITVSNHSARAGYAADALEDAGFKVLGAIGADTYQTEGGKLAVKIAVPKNADVPGARPATADAAVAAPAKTGAN
jgi:rhodanese-related sulfurtransferase